MTLQPFDRAESQALTAFPSMPVLAMTPFTPSCSLPPSVVNSFWNSIIRMAVLLATWGCPPLAAAGAKVREFARIGCSTSTNAHLLPQQPILAEQDRM